MTIGRIEGWATSAVSWTVDNTESETFSWKNRNDQLSVLDNCNSYGNHN